MRWVLNTFPTWVLMIVMIGGFGALAALGHLFVRKRWPHFSEGKNNDLVAVVIGALIGVYGIVLAFVIVALYEDLKEAESVVRAEATSLAQLLRNADAFPDGPRDELEATIGDYVTTVVDEEWELMQEGRASSRASDDVDAMYVELQSFEPSTESEIAFYGESVAVLDELVSQRRERIEHAEESLPGHFLLLIFTGAFLLIGSMLFYGSANPSIQTVMMVGVAALTGFNLLVVLVLDYPFSGDIAVTPHVFTEGALAQFFPGA